MSVGAAAAIKAAIAVLSNEEARKKVGWVIVAILSPLIVLVVLLCAISPGPHSTMCPPWSCVSTAALFPPALRRNTEVILRRCGTALPE